MTKSSPSIWHLLHNDKSTVKISSIFVAFLETMNFSRLFRSLVFYETVATIFRQVFSFHTKKKSDVFGQILGFSVLTTDNIYKNNVATVS